MNANIIKDLHYRAVASNKHTEALALVISFVTVVYSHHKHP